MRKYLISIVLGVCCLFIAGPAASSLVAQRPDSGHSGGSLNLEAADRLLDTETPAPAAGRSGAEETASDSPDNSADATTTASDSPASPGGVKPKRTFGVISMLRASGVIGFIICLLSLVAVALVIEHALSIRLVNMVPPGFADQILALLNAGQWAQAVKSCRENPSPFAQATAAAIADCELGWDAVEKAAEETLAEQAARLYRKVEYLNVIGNITPMLGLLGTVVGMIYAFQELADSQGFARASDLAEGIYLALITTVQGLVVAIPALAAYAFFCNRIANLVSETTYAVSQVLLPVKKRLAKNKKQPEK